MAALVAAGKAWMDAADLRAEQQYAEVWFLSPSEASEIHELRMQLPSPGQERLEAQARLKLKRRNKS